jgi:putative flippase GtrA
MRPARSSPRKLRTKLGRFAVVGVANTVIDLTAFALFARAGAAPLVANCLGWLTAAGFSYLANRRWSFEPSGKVSPGRAVLRFFSLGALVSLGLSSAAIAAAGTPIGLWPAKLLGTIAAAALNFAAARWSIEDRLR